MIILISILTISQIVSFYLIFSRLKPKIIKPEGHVLKPIPKITTYKDVDPEFTLVYEVLETIKLENWNVIIYYDNHRYTLEFNSKDGSSRVKARIYQDDDIDENNEVQLWSFTISNNGKSVSIGTGESISISIENDILIFLWDYVIAWYEELRNNEIKVYKSSIESIRDSLKTLKRSKKLDSILNG